jgi:hypothetical protein
MTHPYNNVPGDLTQAEKLVSIMGEQGLDEVNGADRAFNAWERFLGDVVSSLLRWIFYAFVCGYFIWELT